MRAKVEQGAIESMLKCASWSSSKMGEKTTVVTCRLQSGFEITETSSCVDPANYNQELGEEIARRRITDKLWLLEGYRLQVDIALAKVDAACRGR
jgi:hypothetical protein